MVAKELMGMICPYCDSRVQQVPDNRCCPNCGGPLGACAADETEKTHGFPEPPLGVYSGEDCWLEIGKDSVRIRKEKIAFTKNTDYEIRYRELTGVVYQSAEGESFGYLCLRCGLNQNTPFLTGWEDGLSDPTTALFKKGANAAFAKVYAFLQSCLGSEPPVAAIRFPEPPVGVYSGRFGTLEITEDAVCFITEFPLTLRTEYRIPFRDLFAVEAQTPNFWRHGTIKVRCWQNRRMDFSEKNSDTEMIMVLNKSNAKEFNNIYQFLKECARIANEAREKSE